MIKNIQTDNSTFHQYPVTNQSHLCAIKGTLEHFENNAFKPLSQQLDHKTVISFNSMCPGQGQVCDTSVFVEGLQKS